MIEKELLAMSQEVSSCTKCELHTGRQNAVFGMGNPFAEIMIIGEGPGKDEDEQGLPFVGKSGQLLDKILSACGLSREENVYIANIVKCRPPQNRDPEQKEKDACLQWLFQQISLIKPQIIVLLGATALKSLIDPEAKITKIRGQWMKWENFWVMPTFHPSALLRNPLLKKDSWEDFKMVVQKYRELVDPDHKTPSEI